MAVTAGHFAQFYESEACLVESVADFIGAALRRGDAGLVIATPEHRAALAQRLQDQGLRLAEAERLGHFAALDARGTLAMLMHNGAPALDLVTHVLGSMLDRAATGGRRVHVFGEMVALLKAAGDGAAALQLERHWNALQQSREFQLFCAYPLRLFTGAEHTADMVGVCLEHSLITPAESYSMLESYAARGEQVALLQQKAVSLEAEIARREDAEQRLRQALAAERAARVAAENALRTRDQFLSIASHELRTPLASLSGRAQLALRRVARSGAMDEARVTRAFQEIKSQADKLARLIDQLLDVSRIEGGRLALDLGEVALAPFLEQIVDLARSRAESHVLRWSIDDDELTVMADALRLEQVLTNLLDNAVKYSPDHGAIDVSARSAGQGWIELSVRDHGLGIPVDRRAHIFERFYQAHEQGYRSGMGLGLFICRQIVELHGGEIRAEFPRDGGTRFVVTLPDRLAAIRDVHFEPRVRAAAD